MAVAPYEVITIPFDKMSRDDLVEVATIQQAQLKRIYDLRAIPNKQLSPTEKIIQWAAHEVLSKEKPDEQGRVRFDPAPIAEMTGLSEATVLRSTIPMCERFGAKREVEDYTTKAGQKCKLVYVVPADSLWVDVTQATPVPEKLRNLPGDERRCACGDTMRRKKRILSSQEVWICEGCGDCIALQPVQELEALEVTYTADAEGLHVVDLPEERDNPQFSEFETEETEGLHVVDLGSEEQTDENSASLYYNNNPPIVDAYGVPLDFIEGWLAQRIGHGEIIHSTGRLDSKNKYLPIRVKGVTFDLAAAIRGDLQHVYGSRPALDNGTTFLLGFDCETPELDAQHLEWQQQLAAAGIPSICWKRRPGRFHLEVYFAEAVDRKAAYAHLISVCPGLAKVPEVFPIGSDQNTGGDDRADFPYSWPLHYRVGDQVIECKAEVMFPGDQVPMKSTGIRTDPRLPWLISQVIIPAAAIPELLDVEKIDADRPNTGGVLLDTPKPIRPVSQNDDGLRTAALQWFYDTHSWEDVTNGTIRKNSFCSPLHDDKTASVRVNANGYTASDYGRTGVGVVCKDKFNWWVLFNGLDNDRELKRLIAEYRNQARIAS